MPFIGPAMGTILRKGCGSAKVLCSAEVMFGLYKVKRGEYPAAVGSLIVKLQCVADWL